LYSSEDATPLFRSICSACTIRIAAGLSLSTATAWGARVRTRALSPVWVFPFGYGRMAASSVAVRASAVVAAGSLSRWARAGIRRCLLVGVAVWRWPRCRAALRAAKVVRDRYVRLQQEESKWANASSATSRSPLPARSASWRDLCEEREPVVSPYVAVYIVVALLMAKTLAGIYLGPAYVCPSCGTRREDRHADECPWKR
jgi:hypothetical protein